MNDTCPPCIYRRTDRRNDRRHASTDIRTENDEQRRVAATADDKPRARHGNDDGRHSTGRLNDRRKAQADK